MVDLFVSLMWLSIIMTVYLLVFGTMFFGFGILYWAHNSKEKQSRPADDIWFVLSQARNYEVDRAQVLCHDCEGYVWMSIGDASCCAVSYRDPGIIPFPSLN